MKKEDLLKILPEMTDEQYAELQRLNGLDVNPVKADRDHYREQLATATKEIESYKAMDIEAVKKSAEEYKTKLQEAENAHKAEIYKRDLSDSLKTAASDFGVKDLSDIRGHLDMEKISLKNGELLGFKEQVETIKTSKPYLFNDGEESKQKEVKIGGFVPAPAGKPAGGKTKEEIMAIKNPVERTQAIAENMNLFR